MKVYMGLVVEKNNAKYKIKSFWDFLTIPFELFCESTVPANPFILDLSEIIKCSNTSQGALINSERLVVELIDIVSLSEYLHLDKKSDQDCCFVC